jgi:hypothetical protein
VGWLLGWSFALGKWFANEFARSIEIEAARSAEPKGSEPPLTAVWAVFLFHLSLLRRIDAERDRRLAA